ncbi:DeoR family transcriptional regulator [Peribacillus huizhouensis]|uniref:DeoR/GlpR family transcriptional regulator of sugar metabolism n=1 Tax=Peribacillus huizhouensis TaxID=1501239 RepID=A0ABR6CQC3_9BACI|nr:DeoR family transcriptional regulator [Peribacillus huizhouensis]MBA9026848.1 DeoR/GlpR family transcriptional regulator of sugar metabolism [Peribacillus huizhouensis]
MLARERQKQIKELVLSRKTLKISELSKKFKVSDMTIHRDIKAMVESGFVVKTFGGISLANQATNVSNRNECVVCYKSINFRLSCRLILTENRVETTCCMHCSFIRNQMLDHEVLEILCDDFFTSTTISARNAYFVMDTTLDLGCCQPQLLPFNQKEHAKRFVRGFGGTVVTFSEVMEIHWEKSKGCC